MVENLLHRPLLNHRAMAQHQHPGGKVGDHRQVVLHQYVSNAHLTLKLFKQLKNARLHRHVQRADRFVKQ